MVLLRPLRSADLAALEVDAVQKLADGVNFVPRYLSKQSRQGKVIAGFFSPAFDEEPVLCQAKTILEYVRVSAERREDTEQTVQ